MIIKTPKTRKYKYNPISENLNKISDGLENRIKFSRSSRVRQKKPVVILFVLLIIVIFLIQYLNKMKVTVPEDVQIKNMEVLK